jgi:YggT family protein
MTSVGIFIIQLLQLYFYCVFAMVVISWLVNFQILNTRNRLVYQIQEFLRRITDPVLRPIQRYVPMVGGMDISPIILILLIMMVQNLIREYWLAII